MYQTNTENNKYRAFVHGALDLKNQGYISEQTFQKMIIGAASCMISQKITHDFNSYIYGRLEPRLFCTH